MLSLHSHVPVVNMRWGLWLASLSTKIYILLATSLRALNEIHNKAVSLLISWLEGGGLYLFDKVECCNVERTGDATVLSTEVDLLLWNICDNKIAIEDVAVDKEQE